MYLAFLLEEYIRVIRLASLQWYYLYKGHLTYVNSIGKAKYSLLLYCEEHCSDIYSQWPFACAMVLLV